MHEWAEDCDINMFLFQNHQEAESRPMKMQPLIFKLN